MTGIVYGDVQFDIIPKQIIPLHAGQWSIPNEYTEKSILEATARRALMTIHGPYASAESE